MTAAADVTCTCGAGRTGWMNHTPECPVKIRGREREAQWRARDAEVQALREKFEGLVDADRGDLISIVDEIRAALEDVTGEKHESALFSVADLLGIKYDRPSWPPLPVRPNALVCSGCGNVPYPTLNDGWKGHDEDCDRIGQPGDSGTQSGAPA